MICKVCSNKMQYIRSNWYYCENCDEMYRLEVNEDDRSPWYEQLSANPELWFKGDKDKFPYIIAHEYNEIEKLTENGQIYGVFFQIKDLLEIFIKFPVLVALSDVYERDPNNSILPTLVKDTLSLGHWKDLAQTLKKCDIVHKDIKALLAESWQFYHTNDIVTWRNNIAHGALKNITDEEFKKDTIDKLSIIKEYMNIVEEKYVNYDFFYYLNNNKLSLKGVINPENPEKKLLHCYINIDGIDRDLYPYVYLDERGLFIYDTYYSRKQKTDVLNYPKGQKRAAKKEIHEIFHQIYTKFNLPLTQIKIGNSMAIDTYSKSDKILLDNMTEVDDFEPPHFIKNWLKSRLDDKAKPKGIYMLQMERGMGKTTFCRSLDQLSLNKYKGEFEKYSIRSYYINDVYLYKRKNFILEMNELLTKNDDGISEIGGLVGMNFETENPARQLADFLNRSFKEHKRHFRTKNIEKLVLILDGLDEIPPKEEQTIFDYIPDRDMLDDGIFILVTSRVNDELSEYTRMKINEVRVKIDETYVVKAAGSENIETADNYTNILSKYIEKNIIKKLNIPQINIKETSKLILKKAENRFLYLRIIKELLLSKKDMHIDSIAIGKGLLHGYLENLHHLYGDKYYSNILNILVTVATAFEPITLNELSYLVDREGIDSEILAYLIEVRGFLRVDRSSRGNLISISHKEWLEELTSLYKSELNTLIENWKNKCNQIKNQSFEWQNEIYDGETYITAYIFDYLLIYTNEDYNGLLKDLYESRYCMAKTLGFSRDYRHHIERSLHILNDYIGIYEKVNDTTTAEELTRYINLILIRSKLYMKKEQYVKCKEDYTKALSILDEWGKVESDYNKYLRGTILNELGNICNKLKEKAAFKYYDLALSIFHNAKENSEYCDKKDLVRALNGRGILNYASGRYDDALRDYEEAFALLKELGNKEKESLWKEIITIYSNCSLIYMEKGLLEEALEVSNNAVELVQRSESAGETICSEMKCICYMNRGIAYDELGEKDKAMDDYNIAIKIAKDCIEKGILFNYNDLADVYINRAMIFEIKRKAKEALDDLEKSIELRNSISEISSNQHIDRNKLAISYLNRGNVYSNVLDDPIKASKDYKMAIDIWEELKSRKAVIDVKSLVLAYHNLGNVLKDDNYAVKAYTNAINLMDQLSKQGLLSDKNLLIKCYLRRSEKYAASSRQSDFSRAINDLNVVMPIFRSNKIDEGICVLAFKIFSEIGKVCSTRNRVETEKFCSFAINLWEKNKDIINILFDERKTADLFFVRGMIYAVHKKREYEEQAAQDMIKAAEIWESDKEDVDEDYREKMILSYYFLSDIYFARKDWERIELYSNKILDNYESSKDKINSKFKKELSEIIIPQANNYLGSAVYMIGKKNDNRLQIFNGLNHLKIADKMYEDLKLKGKKVDEVMHYKIKKNIYQIEIALLGGGYF